MGGKGGSALYKMKQDLMQDEMQPVKYCNEVNVARILAKGEISTEIVGMRRCVLFHQIGFCRRQGCPFYVTVLAEQVEISVRQERVSRVGCDARFLIA